MDSRQISAVHDNLNERVGAETLNKIKKMLDRAEHNATGEHEAHTAMTMAMQMLAKHNLDVTDVKVWAEGLDAIGEEYVAPRKGTSHLRWQSSLLHAVAESHFCYTYRNGGTGRYTLIGKPSNREAALMLFHYLIEVVNEETKKALKNYNGWDSPKSFGNSFRLGMVNRIRERLHAEMLKITEEYTERQKQAHREAFAQDGIVMVSDIVVSDPYEVAQENIQRYIKTKGTKLFSGRASSTNLSGAGYNAGRQRGDSVGLAAGRALPGKR